MTTRQYMIPGGNYINETSTRQYTIVGGRYINESSIAVTPTTYSYPVFVFAKFGL